MAFTVDRSTYNKASHLALRNGYQLRNTVPTSIVVHSTSNPYTKETLFENEAKYLYDSIKVSAHFLIGKSGQIIRFLDPLKYQAWHAGVAKTGYENAHSIGIELHHSVDDPPYPSAQKGALTWLVRELMHEFGIPVKLVETHRAIALPAGRKQDPANWNDQHFYEWREHLITLARLWIVEAADGVNVREQPSPAAPKLAHAIAKGALFHGSPVSGVEVDGNAVWIARLPSEGGGYLWSGAVKEVV